MGRPPSHFFSKAYNAVIGGTAETVGSGHPTEKPGVSICIPTYNNEQTIDRTLSSILCQTYSALEIIVVDDCSTDATVGVVRRISERDRRLKLYRNTKNLGIFANWNRCIGLASGEMVGIFHGDDIYEESIVSKQVNYLQRVPTAGAVFASAVIVSDTGKVLGEWPTPEMPSKTCFFLEDLLPLILAQGNFLVCPSALVRKGVYEEVGLYNSELVLAADLDMWLRILDGKWGLGILREPLMKYRLSRDQTSQQYHRNRSTGSEHFAVVNTFLQSKTALRAKIPKTIWRCYQNRKARDLLKRALSLLIAEDFQAAKPLLMDALASSRSVKLSSITFAALSLLILSQPASRRFAQYAMGKESNE